MPGSFEVIKRTDDIGETIRTRVLNRRPDPRIGRQMNDHVHTTGNFQGKLLIQDIPNDQLGKIWVRFGGRRLGCGLQWAQFPEGSDAGKVVTRPHGQVVDDAEGVTSFGRQLSDQVDADETTTTRNEPFHRLTSSPALVSCLRIASRNSRKSSRCFLRIITTMDASIFS